ELDGTPLVTGDGPVSVRISSTISNGTDYSSKENDNGNAPELVVTLGNNNSANSTTIDQPTSIDKSSTFPLRAAFYYPWFPNAWEQSSIFPYTNYTPTLGFYDSSDQTIIHKHIEAMQYGHIEAGIASWWGQGTHTDLRIDTILAAAADSDFRWSLYYEMEGQGDPAVNVLENDLIYIRDKYSADPSFLHIDGRFVVFVYADTTDACDMADRWKQANTVNAYIVLKVFPGYRSCTNQPDGWHQYAPAQATDVQDQYSFTISPGFWKIGEYPRLTRDLARWKQNIQDMIASNANFQLITSFNEWGEGTAVESADEWNSASGYGSYLDALHYNGVEQRVYLPIILRPYGDSEPTPDPTPDPAPSVLVGAGDIADCDIPGANLTAALLDTIPGTVATFGDNAYESGSLKEFMDCYEPTWGRHKARTRPAVGNHEYLTADAAGYFAYFGAAAGDPDKGYYSYNRGAWHIVVINSNCSQVGGCQPGSPQEEWLRADLAADSRTCTLAYWHHPRFSSGEHGNFESVEPIWDALYENGAELVLVGHDHIYERFAPQDPTGVADPVNGIRQFVVGSGGKNHRSAGPPIANSEALNDDTFGVLKLTLRPTSYDWEFVPEEGGTFTDSGSGLCH
ncbi:MAG TPA: metallophosphoesterase, partial [Anaerolineae bacterium]|nr:metallophosphoesterase [Anaerolineae bacterium]